MDFQNQQLCAECEKKDRQNPMTLVKRYTDKEEYQHLADILDYRCNQCGHKFRVVGFL